MSTSEKTALITGASSGIGLELARIHAAQSGNLILVARRKEKLDELKAELEGAHRVAVTTIAQDLAQAGAAQAVFDAVKSQGLQVDYLINNAGLGGRGEFHEMDMASIDAQLNVNMIALTQLTRLFLPEFVSRGSGRILNTSSTASFFPGPLQAVYYATKAYVTFFGNALDEELRGTGITVTTLMPGATESEFAQVSGMDKTSLFDRTAPASEVAAEGYRAMQDGQMDIVSGVTLPQRIMLRLSAFFPKRMMLKTIHRMQKV